MSMPDEPKDTPTPENLSDSLKPCSQKPKDQKNASVNKKRVSFSKEADAPTDTAKDEEDSEKASTEDIHSMK